MSVFVCDAIYLPETYEFIVNNTLDTAAKVLGLHVLNVDSIVFYVNLFIAYINIIQFSLWTAAGDLCLHKTTPQGISSYYVYFC
jgi:hypothetical protein